MAGHGEFERMKRLMMACLSSKRPLAIDSFDRANGALGTADLGGAWIANLGTFSITSNQAKETLSGGTSVATLTISQLDYDVSADITWYSGDTIGLIARCDSSGVENFMRLRYDGSTIDITKTVSSTLTVLNSYSFTWGNGTIRRLRFSCSGNKFIGYVDGVEVISTIDDNPTKTKYNAGMSAAKVGSAAQTLFNNLLVMG